jgi:hypothetical protein
MTPPVARTYLATGRSIEIGARLPGVALARGARSSPLVPSSPLPLDLRREIAEPLARLARFHGQACDDDGEALNVSEHSTHGADAIEAELIAAGWTPAAARKAALAFLVHDCHEVITADPPKNFVAMLGLKFAGVSSHASLIADAIDEVKGAVDDDLGLVIDLPDYLRAQVALMDRRMAAAEIDFCFRRPARLAGREPPPLDVGLDVLVIPDVCQTGRPGYPDHWRFWNRRQAADEWLKRWKRLAPSNLPSMEIPFDG